MSEIFMHISAGSGPKECQWVVAKLAQAFVKEARAQNLLGEIILGDEDRAKTYSSLLLKLSGVGAQKFAQARTGSIRWIGQSPFRKNHKRKNWFVGVTVLDAEKSHVDFKESDIRYQAMKASGPGGQHVNATQSAVRATHIPTGVSVVAREERSQHANKRLCRIKLAMVFEDQKTKTRDKAKQDKWQQNHNLERGNAVRIYEGVKFRLKT